MDITIKYLELEKLKSKAKSTIVKFLLSFGFLLFLIIRFPQENVTFLGRLEYLLLVVGLYAICSLFVIVLRATRNYIIAIIIFFVIIIGFGFGVDYIIQQNPEMNIIFNVLVIIALSSFFIFDIIKIFKMAKLSKEIKRCDTP